MLRLAVNTQRWDLAAHTIILASARALKKGGAHGETGTTKKKPATTKKR